MQHRCWLLLCQRTSLVSAFVRLRMLLACSQQRRSEQVLLLLTAIVGAAVAHGPLPAQCTHPCRVTTNAAAVPRMDLLVAGIVLQKHNHIDHVSKPFLLMLCACCCCCCLQIKYFTLRNGRDKVSRWSLFSCFLSHIYNCSRLTLFRDPVVLLPGQLSA